MIKEIKNVGDFVSVVHMLRNESWHRLCKMEEHPFINTDAKIEHCMELSEWATLDRIMVFIEELIKNDSDFRTLYLNQDLS